LIAGLVYIGALLTATHYFISDQFSYLGYVDRSASWSEILAAIGISGLLILLAPAKWDYPSKAAFAFLLATIAIPVVWLPVLYGPLNTANLVTLHLAVAGAFTAARLILAGGRLPLRLVSDAHRGFIAAIISLTTVGALVYFLVGQQMRPTLVGFADVYDVRSQYVKNIDVLGSYLVGALGNGVFPVALALGLHRRSIRLMSVGVLGTLVLYSFTGFKVYLVGLVLAVVGFCLARWWRHKGSGWFVGLSGAIVLACAIDVISGTIVSTSLLVRRALTTTGINTAYYVDFFSTRPRYELKHSVLSFTGPAPYPTSPARLIGGYYYQSTGTAANANLIADGFANFGLLGCLIAGVLLGLSLRLYDRLSAHLPLTASSTALIFVLLAVANTAPLTILATHGGLMLAAVIATVSADRASIAWLSGSPSVRHRRIPKVRGVCCCGDGPGWCPEQHLGHKISTGANFKRSAKVDEIGDPS